MDEDDKKRRGRPRKDGVRKNRVQIKMNDEELEMFRYVYETEGNTMTNAILDAIRVKYNLLKYSK